MQIQTEAEERGVGYLADRSPTGVRRTVLVTRDEDGEWTFLGEGTRRLRVPKGETIYATEIGALHAAHDRWRGTHGA